MGASSGGKQGRYDPVMSAMAMPLSDEDIADLAAYYASMPISGNTTPEDVVAQGKVLLYRWGCITWADRLYCVSWSAR